VAENGRPLFSIGAVARMLDLSPATIRTWESRYGLVVPERSEGGQRLYSRVQVEQLRFVKDEVGRGRRPAEAHRLLAEQAALSERGGPAKRVLLAESKLGAADLLRRLLGSEGFEVVLTSDPAAAVAHLDDVAPTLAVVDTEDDGFADLLSALHERGARVVPAQGLLEQARTLGS
jgi:DNA-binding transcriptional MerR regulator